MGISKKQRDKIWSNVPRLLSKEEIEELSKVNDLYDDVQKIKSKYNKFKQL